MLVRFEHNSERVKGLAFHPQRPWILASLHNGIIQLLDYSMETILEQFEEHEGPVRGIDFHSTQPLFVSGGDDYKIKVWNYQLKRCLFTLHGHLDYIRTVQFHLEQPWILSASDDQTIRIWNWQSRNCLTVLTGHNHYVMCARFHPTQDLVVSASLDQSVRVWDITSLRKNNTSIAKSDSTPTGDLFGSMDVVVKYVLEGHTRGVNWAAFHPKKPYVISGADDREVKLWRMSESKGWELDTMRGHSNNVSSVVFHPNGEFIVSNSEDKSIRVWDITRQASPLQFPGENRYWIIGTHPTKNILAAGHDSGLTVFKLNRERPAYDAHKHLFYCKDRYVRCLSFKNQKDLPLFSVANDGRAPRICKSDPRTLIYNSLNNSEHNILLISDTDGGSYGLYTMSKKKSQADQKPLRGLGKSAAFTTRNRFAVLDPSNQIYLKSLANETKKRIPLPFGNVNHIFSAGVGRLLLRTPNKIYLFDLQTRKIINEIRLQGRHPIKYVVWSRDRRYVALMSKFHVYLATSRLKELCTLTETSRVKSGVWDPAGYFVYTTSTHIKYCLTSGDNGIVRTLQEVIYLTAAASTHIHYIDRKGQCGILEIDNTEPVFKKALIERNLEQVLRIVQSNALIGKSIIAYLQKKGYPEVALHFVQDEKTRLSLALQCGNIDVATESCLALNDKESWTKLGLEALNHGDQKVVESAYRKTKDLEKLAFLYLVVGNIKNLNKLLQISKQRNDVMGRFHTSLYLGNVEERVQVLKDTGQLGLAYITSRTYGIECNDLVEALGEESIAKLEDQIKKNSPNGVPKHFIPPSAILRQSRWPMHAISKGYFDEIVVDDEEDGISIENQEGEYDNMGGEQKQGIEPEISNWESEGEEDNLDDNGRIGGEGGLMVNDEDLGVGDGWGGDGGFDLGIDLPDDKNMDGEEKDIDMDGFNDDKKQDGDFIAMPTFGRPWSQRWRNFAEYPADMICAGQFDLAMSQLNKQFTIVNFKPMKSVFLTIYQSVRLEIPTLPDGPYISTAFARSKTKRTDYPMVGITVAHCTQRLKKCLKQFSDGSGLENTLESFRYLLVLLPLLVFSDDDKDGIIKAKEMLSICKEYIVAMKLEIARRKEKDPVKQCELALLFADCKLQSIHCFFTLRVAIKSAYTIKNYKTAGALCRRFIEMTQLHKLPKNLANSVGQVKGVLRVCGKHDKDTHKLVYDPQESFSIDSFELCALPFGTELVYCALCKAGTAVANGGKLCACCNLCKYGSKVMKESALLD